MVMEDVCQELARADVVVAKVDAPNEELFCQINKPFVDHNLDDILQALKSFRRRYEGKLALQIMFMEANASRATEMAAVAREILPDEVQVNTPLRPCPIRPLPSEELASIGREFASVARTLTVYEAEKKAVVPMHLRETLRRRPAL